jgi:glucan phosphorylase
MGTKRTVKRPTPAAADGPARLLDQYGCGPIPFTGTDHALYERHLMFDNVVGLKAAGPRERFEACARAVRDVLAQRWVSTEDTYERENPKHVDYLEADRRLVELYADAHAWSRRAMLNVAGSGKFSSDRTIVQYAAEIWNVQPCPVP